MRAHVEFVQAQRLRWEKGAVGGAREAFEAKHLSRDPVSGATSCVVRIPAGWSAGGAVNTDEEIFLLDGDLAIDGLPLAPYGYAHLPAGSENALRSERGAVALWFTDRTPQSAPAAAFDPARRVILDTHAIPYTGNFHPEFPPGAGRKWLFRDPDGGEETWLLGTMALRNAARQEIHPVVEEMFLLAGEVHSDRGVMQPGAYFWRPPEIPHGPFGTRTGNLYLFRTIGGPLSTDYVDGAGFGWRRPYRAELPPEQDYARGEVSGAVDWASV